MKYQQLVTAIEAANEHLVGRAVAAVNQALVLRNWIVGAYLVEFEQNGEDRARYGEKLIDRLGEDLGRRKLQGMSPTYLRIYRELYRVYPQVVQLFLRGSSRIQQTLSVEFPMVRVQMPIQQAVSVELARVLSVNLTRSALEQDLSPQLESPRIQFIPSSQVSSERFRSALGWLVHPAA